MSNNPAGSVVIDNEPVKDTNNRQGIAVVVIDRKNREVVLSGTTPRDSGGLQHLSDIVKRYTGSDGYLIVLGGAMGVAPSAVDELNSLAKSVGAADLSKDNLARVGQGAPFSILGVPGATAGAAWTNVGRKGDGVEGNITGYVQYVAKDGLYGFASTEMPTFEMTKLLRGGPRTNTITLDGMPYPASLPAGYTAGFETLFADSLTGKPFFGFTQGTNCSCDQALAQEGFAGLLRHGMSMAPPSGRPPLVLIQSIGKPAAAGPGWAAAGNLIAKLGGNRPAFMQLNGQSGYSLVGSEAANGSVAEASDVTGEPGPLVGVLARTHDYGFLPVVAGPFNGVNTQLVAITNQAPTAFPSFTPAQQAAEAYIGRAVGLCPVTGCSVREEYYLGYQRNWDALFSRVSNPDLKYPGSSEFSEQDFEAVKRQLTTEFGAVAEVKKYFEALQAPFFGAAGKSHLDLKDLGDKIYNAVAPPPVEADYKTPFVLGLLGKIAALGGFLGPPESSVAAGISAGFALAAYVMQPDGSPVLPTEIKVRADRLIKQYKDALLMAAGNLTHDAVIDVSDYGKLMAIYHHLSDPRWRLPSDPAEGVGQIGLAAQQWLAERLIPLAYPLGLWVSPPPPKYYRYTDANAVLCTAGFGTDFNTWSNQPANAQIRVLQDWTTQGKVEAVYWFSRNPGGRLDSGEYAPKPEIADMLFKPANPSIPQLGINPLTFYTPQVFGRLRRAYSRTKLCGVL